MRIFFHFLFFLPPPPPPRSRPSLLFPSSCIHRNSDFTRIMSSQFIQNHHTFYADFYTLRQYGLRIRNQCNSIGIAVIFTAHTLRRATLFPQGILFKIRADKQKKKKQRRLTIINRVLISMNNRTTPKTWGGHLILCPPPSKSWGGRVPPVPPGISAHAPPPLDHSIHKLIHCRLFRQRCVTAFHSHRLFMYTVKAHTSCTRGKRPVCCTTNCRPCTKYCRRRQFCAGKMKPNCTNCRRLHKLMSVSRCLQATEDNDDYKDDDDDDDDDDNNQCWGTKFT